MPTHYVRKSQHGYDQSCPTEPYLTTDSPLASYHSPEEDSDVPDWLGIFFNPAVRMPELDNEREAALVSRLIRSASRGPFEPASRNPSELRTVSIDEDGDLQLKVTTESGIFVRNFIVCSRTMGRSSPVWKKMLFGNFKEAKPTRGEWIVSLQEKDLTAFLTILNIIHGIFDEVPEEPSIERLYQILALTDKYDMVKKLRPWAASWSSLLTRWEEEHNLERLVFVAWELGQEQVFCPLVERLVLGSYMDSDGRLVMPSGSHLEDLDHIGPQDLAGKADPFPQVFHLI